MLLAWFGNSFSDGLFFMIHSLVIFDLDGTLYRGDEVIPFAAETVARLRSSGAGIRYLTNNSSQTRAFYRAKLWRMGFEAEEDEIYSSATGTAAYLASQNLTSVFVVGMPGLISTFREADIEVVNASGEGHAMPEGRPAQAVAVGICLDFTYALMSGAMQQIRNGAAFVATNPDTTFPLEGGRLVPGAGSIVAAVQACSGVVPFVVGKPNPYLIDLILKDAGCAPENALVVGDRLDTDIESGQRAGCETHLVLTGVESAAPYGQRFSEDLRGL